MPSNLVKKYVREGKGSKKSLEDKWKKAKKAAEKGDAEDKWALTTHIFKNMVGASIDTTEINAFISEMRDASVQKASILDKVELNAAQRLLSVED